MRIYLWILLLAFVATVAAVFIALYIVETNKKNPVSPSPKPLPPVSGFWKGKDIMEAFSTFECPDPTHGAVLYGNEGISYSGDAVKLSIGELVNSQRRAVRLQSDRVFDSGTFAFDIAHMPEGLTTWPALWMNSDVIPWACGGEIDIIEVVNSVDAASSKNTSTLHTNNDSCVHDGIACNSASLPTGQCGCSGDQPCPNNGCPILWSGEMTAGFGFNQHGGGVFAWRVTAGGLVTVWFWTRAQAPDISTGTPETWGTPTETHEFTACPNTFSSLRIVLNTTLCGDWAGQLPNCLNLVKTSDFSKAFWEVNGFRII